MLNRIINTLLVILFLLGINLIFTTPYIFKPLSPYSAWDEGYRMKYGEYPKTCDSRLCKAHHKGFWPEVYHEIFDKDTVELPNKYNIEDED